ncbi:MAG: TIGR02206 family membrane protein [Candidatus Saccharimonadales bacterium]
MISDFQLFGYQHILSIILPIIVGVIYILLAKKYPKNLQLISILFATTIVLTRSVRYVFDAFLGKFEIYDLLSIHVCHIDLILLVICLIWPNRKFFTFNFLIGIPTALAVALLPGQTHADPGMARAIFFIMSHMLLVMGAIYLLFTYKFEITKKDVGFYYLFSLIGIIAIYIFNTITHANFMYLMEGPKNTVLGLMYGGLGPFWYIVSIYVILITLLTFLYQIYKLVIKKIV